MWHARAATVEAETQAPTNFLQSLGLICYNGCKILQIHNLHYNTASGRLEKSRRHKHLVKLIKLLQILVISCCLLQKRHLQDFLNMKQFLLRMSYSDAQSCTLKLLTYFTQFYGIGRIAYALLSRRYQKLLLQLVNELLLLYQDVERHTRLPMSGMPQDTCGLIGINLLLLLAVVWYAICSYTSTAYNILLHCLLLQFTYFGYQSMQLSLLQLHLKLNQHMAATHRKDLDSDKCRRYVKSLQQQLSLLRRLQQLHHKFTRLFAWLPELCYWQIFIAITQFYAVIVCVFNGLKGNTWLALQVDWVFALVISFWWNLLLIGAFNDQMRLLAAESNDHLSIARVRVHLMNTQNQWRYTEIERALDMHVLGKNLFNFRNYIFSHILFDRKFAFAFFVTLFLHSTSCAHYHLSNPVSNYWICQVDYAKLPKNHK